MPTKDPKASEVVAANAEGAGEAEKRHTPTPYYSIGREIRTVKGRDLGFLNGEIVARACNHIQDLDPRYGSLARSGADLSNDAAFIVRACNSHDALVAACKAALVSADYEGKREFIREKLIAALALATSEVQS